jgi:hypothetical protein
VSTIAQNVGAPTIALADYRQCPTWNETFLI